MQKKYNELIIQSPENKLFKSLLKLSQSKEIKKQNQFLISGKKIIHDLQPRWLDEVLFEIRPQDFEPCFPLKPQLILSSSLFNQIDFLGTHFNLLLLKHKPLQEVAKFEYPKGLEILIASSDPLNLGAIIRSACGFGVNKIYLSPESAHPFHPKSIRSSAGSSLFAPLLQLKSDWKPSFLNSLHVFSALDLKGLDISKIKLVKNQILLLGEEGKGLKRLLEPTELSQIRKYSIKTLHIESLNVNVASGIAMYEYFKSQTEEI